MDIRNLLSLQPIPNTNVYHGTRIEKEMPEILVYLKLWGNNTRVLWGFHIFLGIFATFFSMLAATSFVEELPSKVFAFVAALSIAFLTAFNLGAKSNNTRNAWRLLNTAVLRFNEGLLKKDGVIDAYEKGEALIGGISFSQAKVPEESDALSTFENSRQNDKNPKSHDAKSSDSDGNHPAP